MSSNFRKKNIDNIRDIGNHIIGDKIEFPSTDRNKKSIHIKTNDIKLAGEDVFRDKLMCHLQKEIK